MKTLDIMVLDAGRAIKFEPEVPAIAMRIHDSKRQYRPLCENKNYFQY